MKNCLHCKEDFEPKSGKQVYCSNRCKVAFKRAQDKLKFMTTTPQSFQGKRIDLGDLEDMVTTADKINNKKEWHEPSETQLSEMIHFNDANNELAERLKSFCKQYKTNPDDLFSWLMDNYVKAPEKPVKEKKQSKEVIIQDINKTNVVGKPYDPMNNPMYRKKMGLKD